PPLVRVPARDPGRAGADLVRLRAHGPLPALPVTQRTASPTGGPRPGARLAGLVLACCLVALAACSGADDEGGDGSTTTTAPAAAGATTAPAGPPPGATEAGLRDLEVGNCFDLVDDPVAADRAVWLLDCAEPHSHEVYDVI